MHILTRLASLAFCSIFGLIVFYQRAEASYSCHFWFLEHPSHAVSSISQAILDGESYPFENQRDLIQLLELFKIPGQYLAGPKKILVAGAGVGIMSMDLARNGHHVDSVDIIDYKAMFEEGLLNRPPVLKKSHYRNRYVLSLEDNRLGKQFFAVARNLGLVPHQFELSDRQFTSEQEANIWLRELVMETLSKLEDFERSRNMRSIVAPADEFLRTTTGRYDLIIDIEGAMAYSTDRLRLLQLYQAHLTEDGVIFATASGFENTFVTRNSQKPESLSDALKRQKPDSYIIGNAAARSFVIDGDFAGQFSPENFHRLDLKLPEENASLEIYPIMTFKPMQ